MSLVLTGNQAATTTPLTATVTAIANNGSGLWRVTTSAPHLFGSDPGGVAGDYVELAVTISSSPVTVYGQIIVIDATHFDVLGTTYTATGTGSATDLSLTPQIQVPTDGDPGSLQLSGMLSSQSYILHRTQYLQWQTWQIGSGPWTFAGTKTFSGGVTFGENIVVDGNAVVDGSAVVGGQLEVTGIAQLEGGAQIAGAPTFSPAVSVTRTIADAPVDTTTPANVALLGELMMNAGDVIYQPLRLPHGAVVSNVTVTLVGTTHANLPMNLPSFIVYQVAAGGASTSLGSAGDPSVTNAAYEVAHPIPMTPSGGTFTVDLTQYTYWLRFTAESGTNSNNNSVFHQTTWTGAISTLDVG
jgi:hypothetical protein